MPDTLPTSWQQDTPVTPSGLLGSFTSGAISGASSEIAPDSFGFGPGRWLLGNGAGGLAGYTAGQLISGRSVTVGGLVENAGLSVAGAYDPEQLGYSGSGLKGIYGAGIGATISDASFPIDAVTGFGNLFPIPWPF